MILQRLEPISRYFESDHYFVAARQFGLDKVRENPYIYQHVRNQRLAQGILARRPGHAAAGNGRLFYL